MSNSLDQDQARQDVQPKLSRKTFWKGYQQMQRRYWQANRKAFSFWIHASRYFGNSEDLDEMPHIAAFHQSLYYLLRLNHIFSESSGRVLDWRSWGSGFEPHRRHCVVSLSKNINPSLVLVQPRKTRPFIIERLLMGRKESYQTNKIISSLQKHTIICDSFKYRMSNSILISSTCMGKIHQNEMG